MTPFTTADMTDEQVRALPVDQLARALVYAAGDEDNARRGAMHALVGYGDLSLIRLRPVRAYVVNGGNYGPLVQWQILGRHLTEIAAPGFDPDHHHEDDRRRGLLNVRNSTALDALRLAVTLADGTYAVNLRGMAGRFGAANRIVMAEAVAIAFGVRGTLNIGAHERNTQ